MKRSPARKLLQFLTRKKEQLFAKKEQLFAKKEDVLLLKQLNSVLATFAN